MNAEQIVTLLGRNGAGKSTLLSIIAGLLDPDAGAVRAAGNGRSRPTSSPSTSD